MPKVPPPKPPTDTPSTDLVAPDVPASILVRAAGTDDADTLAALAEAGIVVDGDGNDGLSEVLVSDLKTPAKLWNLKKADGVARIAQDQFLDTLDRSVTNELNLILLDMHKTNLYEVYNGERNITHCKSWDRVHGTWQLDTAERRQGVVRSCQGCPDQAWRDVVDKGVKKRSQPCCEVWNVAAFDLDTHRVCLLKFKKTSLPSIRTHFQTHHIGRLPGRGGKMVDVPLCVYRVRVTLEMDKAGNFAAPKIERGARLVAADIRVMYETMQGVRETFEARMREADASTDSVAAGGDDDASFDTQAMDAANARERGTEAFVDG